MRAMILAAGYGTRFQPVTFTLPKPLVPVCNKPLIGWAVESFLEHGISDFVVNLHHLPEQIRAYLPRAFPRARFDFSFEEEILGTGGGVRRARALLEGDGEFLVANGDTIQTVPVEALIRARRDRDAVAALTLRHPPAGDHFTPVFFEDGRVTGFGRGTGEALMFSGSALLGSRLFQEMPEKESFGIVDQLYQPLLQRGATIAAVVDDSPRWFDIGTPRRYLAASRALCGENVIGARSVVDGALHDSVVWDDCRIAAGVTLQSCVVAHGVEIGEPGEYRDLLICRGEDGLVTREM
jgi:mannose-1-phosphate guanylyltransferase/mannose-1-phosphate guanylyltransferase/phosphomannomutase